MEQNRFTSRSFQALVASSGTEENAAAGKPARIESQVRTLNGHDLPSGDVLIQVRYSSINYKDALALAPGNSVVKQYPMVPGIDLAGVVLDSDVSSYKPGDHVIATGHGLGTSHFGGYSELARVPADWITRLPAEMPLRESMMLGTAGLTAALSLYRLELNGLTPDNGTVLVTGASGGVGSLAVGMLAHAGYHVTAVTGKPDAYQRLRDLGAADIVSRSEWMELIQSAALGKQRWAGAIDPVGGASLAGIVSTLQHGGSVAVSGLTGGTSFSSTVFPFILRGASILGIDSVECPASLRELLWERMATCWRFSQLADGCYDVTLAQIPGVCRQLLAGTHQGRAVVRLGQD